MQILVQCAIQQAGFEDIFQQELPLIVEPQVSPISSSAIKREDGLRFLTLIAGKIHEDWVQVDSLPELDYASVAALLTQTDDQDTSIVYRPFRLQRRKIVSFAEIDLNSGHGIISVKSTQVAGNYKSKFEEFCWAFDDLLRLSDAEKLHLIRAISHVDNPAHQAYLHLPRHYLRGDQGERMRMEASSGQGDVRQHTKLQQARNIFNAEDAGDYCDCLLGTARPSDRKKSIPAFMVLTERLRFADRRAKEVYDMYYSESDILITNTSSDKNDLLLMDRAIARSYGASGHGWLDNAVLEIRTKLDAGRVNNLIRRYERLNVVSRFEPLECSNGHTFEPDESECPDCQASAIDAIPSGLIRYRVLKQPQEPLFDLGIAKGPFQVFISYRHGDTKHLAADTYYALKARNLNVFLDSGLISPGADFEKVFLPAASETPHFLSLISPTYFDSDYCKAELAHALRSAKNVIPVLVGGNFTSPNDMPWLNKINPSPVTGNGQGLSRELEDFLLPIVQQSPAPANYNHRLDAWRISPSKNGAQRFTQSLRYK